MKILAIDTATNTATAAVNDDARLVVQHTSDYKRTHSQKIMPMIDMVLSEAELSVGDIDLFAVSNGPGSFTGVRIGVATMNALAHATNKPIIAVSSLEALAYNSCETGDVVCPIIDARHENIYHAIYEWRGGELFSIGEPADGALETFITEVAELGRSALFLGDGALTYREKILSLTNGQAHIAGAVSAVPQASSVAACAWRRYVAGGQSTYLQVRPCYLKKSQAERESIERKKNKC